MVITTQRVLFAEASLSQDQHQLKEYSESATPYVLGWSDRLSLSIQQKDRTDLAFREFAVLLPFVIIPVWLMVAPAVLLDHSQPTLSFLLQRAERHTETSGSVAPLR